MIVLIRQTLELIIDIMQNIPKIPSRYYHLALLNIGLLIALFKGMTLVGIASSLVFTLLATAPIALYFGILSPPPHQIIQEDIKNKLKEYYGKCNNYFVKWQMSEQQKQTKLVIQLLVALYISYNFLCPCIETLIIFNISFVFFFLHEEFQQLKGLICSLCPCCSQE